MEEVRQQEYFCNIPDLRQFLSVVDKVRDKALILLLLRTGMRIGELLSSNVCDVNIKEQKSRASRMLKRICLDCIREVA